MVLRNDRQAILAAIKTCLVPDPRQVRFGRIKNTLRFHEMEISENLLDEARANQKMEILSGPYDLAFDERGNLF
jgi:hypothetical protein